MKYSDAKKKLERMEKLRDIAYELLDEVLNDEDTLYSSGKSTYLLFMDFSSADDILKKIRPDEHRKSLIKAR